MVPTKYPNMAMLDMGLHPIANAHILKEVHRVVAYRLHAIFAEFRNHPRPLRQNEIPRLTPIEFRTVRAQAQTSF